MKNPLILILTISIFIYSCNNYENYKAPANVIIQNYGGELAYGAGVGVSNGNKYDYLSVELSKSLFLQYGILPGNVITHIATEFAKVTPHNIKEIHIELVDIPTDNGTRVFSEKISIEEAKLIISKENILHNCFDKIALNNITELTPFLTEDYKTSFIEKDGELAIKGINEMIGQYKGSMFRGYDFMGNDSILGKDFILLNGLMLGSKVNAELSIIIDPEKPDNECIVALRY
ncbi:MAG: hypothetical protein DWQ02_10360 [Bacteroidetes bacterium]|nr:MAG: hypothetical protein DWQ02_10360 [Bacteroidota bacterium]